MKTIGTSLDKFWNWLVTSSANEGQIALTVQGFLATGIAYIIGIVGATHLNIPDLSTNLNFLASEIILFIQYGLGIVGVISTVVGIVRKIWISVSGLFSSATPKA
jgi:hypothetical protein